MPCFTAWQNCAVEGSCRFVARLRLRPDDRLVYSTEASYMYLLYSVLLSIYFLGRLPAIAYASWKYRKPLGSVRERLGRLPDGVNPDHVSSIWIHAVSVGEALAVRPLVRSLRAAYTDHRLVLSTTTVTGQQVARQFGDELDAVFYAPFDFIPLVTRALDRIAPELLIVVDTEIWPNLLRACRRRGVRTMLVNGRLSDRSFRGYRLVRPFMRQVLDHIDQICVQTEQWAQRFVDLGADAARVTVTGSMKFDAVSISATSARHHVADRALGLFEFAKTRPVFIAASTLRGEEEPVLRAFGRMRETAPNTLLVLAPRHPDRFAEARTCAEAAGYQVHLRSDLNPGGAPDAAIVLLDTMGELGRLFQIASTVFIGGSLVPAGGHNLLEPAAFGKAIVVGPHMENFAEVTEQFVSQQAVVQVRSEAELEATLVDLMHDSVRRASLGAAALALVDAHRGATQRSMDVAAELLPPGTRSATGATPTLRVVQ